jgi:dTDP-4-amino-4,6-dideoxygalactose transaminase
MNVFSGTNSIEEIKTVLRTLKSTSIVEGKDIEAYHARLQNSLGSKKIYTFASGRMGFYSILKSIDIKEDDEIIIPSYTCIVVPNAILYSGAKPIYCDIGKDDFNIDVSKIKSLITPKTKILYAQHTFGQMCDITAIIELAHKYNLIVIEDAALALGAKLNGKFAGTIGDFGYYSTDRSKVINTGLGGIVSINNAKFIKEFEKYYLQIPYLDQKTTKKIALTFLINLVTLNPYLYWIGKFVNAVLTKLRLMTYFLDEAKVYKKSITEYPYPAKLSNILANIGISQINNLNLNIKNRKEIVKYYNAILQIYTDDYVNHNKNIFLRYSFLIKNRDYWENRFASQIDLSIWFKTVASGRYNNFEEIYYAEGSNQISEYVCDHIFNLPTHHQLKPEKLKKLLLELKNSGDIITKEKVL